MACAGQHLGDCGHGGCRGLIHGEAGPHAGGRYCQARLAELILQYPALLGKESSSGLQGLKSHLSQTFQYYGVLQGFGGGQVPM